MVDRHIGPVELDADMAGLVNLLGDVINLVSCRGQLQPANGYQGKPQSASPLSHIR
jgi:hypothetical protein